MARQQVVEIAALARHHHVVAERALGAGEIDRGMDVAVQAGGCG
ncbi:MAG: hypothetical protein QM722_00650 [Piscinibacter sp.]